MIYLNEESWGLRSLYPLAIRAEVEEDVENAAAFGEKHRDPAGMGFTDLYMREEPSTNFADFGLTIKAVEAPITPIFPRIHRFASVWLPCETRAEEGDPAVKEQEGPLCFGLDADCYLMLETDGPMVANIWFDLSTDDPDNILRMRKAIEAIDVLSPCVIADYFLNYAGPVHEDGVLDAYFARYEEQRNFANQAMRDYRALQEQRVQPLGIVGKLLTWLGVRR